MSTMTLPDVDTITKETVERQVKSATKIVATGKSREQPREIIADEPTGYVRRRVDVKMPHKYAMILHKKLRKLQDGGARLSDGTEVSDHTKAVLWILENEVT